MLSDLLSWVPLVGETTSFFGVVCFFLREELFAAVPVSESLSEELELELELLDSDDFLLDLRVGLEVLFALFFSGVSTEFDLAALPALPGL